MSAISRLYYGTKADKLANAYIDEHEDLILSLLDDSVSDAVTHTLLGEFDDNRSLLEELGLVLGNNVTERGMRIVKAYPIFGTGNASFASYHIEFFPFLFSSILNGRISARSDRFFQSGTFTNMFPSFSAGTIQEAGVRAIKALKELGIIKRNGSWYSLKIDRAISFMEMDELSRLSYLLYPTADAVKRRRILKALHFVLLINDFPMEEWSSISSKIAKATAIQLDLDELLIYGLLSLDDKKLRLTAVRLYGESTLHGVISSDMELSYHGRLPYELWRIAEPVSEDTLTRWIITKQTIKSALDTGLSEEEILSILRRFSEGSVSELIEQRIGSWASQFNTAKASRAILLETDDRTNHLLEELPQLQEYILSHPAPRFFIMESTTEEKWRKELETLGYDMLGRTTGPEFQEEEEFIPFSKVLSDFDFPVSREVPFREDLFKSLLSSVKNVLTQTAVKNHLLFQPNIKFKLTFVDGLDYQAKLSLIEEAIRNNDSLYLLDADLKERCVEPCSIFEEEENPSNLLLKTTTGNLSIGPIWKVAIIPNLMTQQEID